eukprot:COSAG06_NODE_48184_length_334_cov_0.625532_2_plen_25_part_01
MSCIEQKEIIEDAPGEKRHFLRRHL